MARNISISVSVQDQYSQSISSMREKTVAFNKDIEELTAKIKSLNKEKISLNIDAVKAQQTLRDLQQQFKNTGNAADQMVLQLANANYSNVNKQIERISKSSQQAKRELSNLVIDIVKRITEQECLATMVHYLIALFMVEQDNASIILVQVKNRNPT